MLSPKYFIYLAFNKYQQSKIEITSNPRIDAYLLYESGYQQLHLLEPPLPIWMAEYILNKLQKYDNWTVNKFQKSAACLLNEISSCIKLNHRNYDVLELNPLEFEPPDLTSLLWGRSLLGTEIPELIKNSGFDLPWDPEDWLQYFYLHNQIRREAAVTIDSLGLPFCRRCGERKLIMEDNCLFCGNPHCYTCTNCQSMGLAKSCTPLYSQSYPNSPKVKSVIKPKLDFELTPPQQRAAMEVEKFLDTDNKEFLVWAVCGGGKTEVSFAAVAKVLSEGGRVLFAIPRKDVVIELLPRFQQAFPDISISSLYGGSDERFEDTQLTIATTHQCLRFYQGFDLIILDEADAYPYQGSAMLHYAVTRSLKPGGCLVIMTATPDKTLIQRTKNRKLPFVSIPARPHRKPLIVPKLTKTLPNILNINKDWTPPEIVQEFLRELKNSGRKGMIFLPTIRLIEEIGAQIVKWAAQEGLTGDFTHSKADNRNEIKRKLLAGEYQFVVTSTIFERGITIPNLDVMVLFADNQRIFDSRSLIQIAGRAGRKGEAAKVIFIGKSISAAMKEAVQIVKDMNEEGFRLGYLDRT